MRNKTRSVLLGVVTCLILVTLIWSEKATAVQEVFFVNIEIGPKAEGAKAWPLFWFLSSTLQPWKCRGVDINYQQ